MGKKSILLTIDDEEWNRFKSKVCLRGLSVAGVVKGFIASYCLDKQAEGGKREKGPPVLASAGPVAVRKKKREEIPLGREDRSGGPKPGLAEYASLLGVEDGKDRLERTLDAVEKEYAERVGEDGWLEGNMAMVRWYNVNRG